MRGGTVRRNLADQSAVRFAGIERLSQSRRHILRKDTEIAMLHFAVGENLVHVMARHVDRDCESDSLVAARITRENGGIDADQMAFVIDQRAARVARIDRRVRLNKVFDLLDSEVPAAGCADNSGCDGLAHAERIADGQYDVTDFDFARVGQRKNREIRPFDFEHGNVGAWIGSYHASLELSLVMQCYGNFLRAIHHVIVGQNIAFGANDDARSKSFLSSLLRHIESLREVVAKELAKEWINALRSFELLASPLSTMKC